MPLMPQQPGAAMPGVSPSALPNQALPEGLSPLTITLPSR